ncbi:MAG: TerB family tellurite resistance protein [Prochlorococcaceae cyanobacterium]|nr:TerB family tellurite resistance protein [Cyanobacteriota bacterium]
MSINWQLNPPLEQRQAMASVGLAGLMTMARLDGTPSPRALAAIRGVRDHLLQVELKLTDLPTLTPADLNTKLRAIDDNPQWRERVLRGMTLVALFDGEPGEPQLELLKQTANAFEVSGKPVTVYRQLLQHKLTMLRLDILRRGFIKEAAFTTLQQEGLPAVLATAKALLGQEDKAMADRHRSLINYPSGSFGKAYADFIRRNGFSFPGEAGGAPPIIHHDCCHVLGGYGTTAAEEGAVVGFQAGFERLDPFDVLMFVMAEFELGVTTSPLVAGQQHQLDPERIFAGISHGMTVNTDLLSAINPWDYFAFPLTEVRERFNIQPRGRQPEYPND